MNVKQLKSLAVQISNAKQHLDSLESQYAAFRLDALREVEMVKNDASITLLFKGRRINAKKPARFNDRYNLTENGKSIGKEVFGGIHDIRFAVAMGQI